MKVIFYGLWFLLLTTVQATLLNYIEIMGVKPNLILIFVIILSFFEGKKVGALVGAILGLIFDIMIGKMVGVDALLYMYSGVLVGMLSEHFLNKPRFIIIMPTVFVLTSVNNILYYLIYAVLTSSFNFTYIYTKVVLPESLYNLIFAIPLFFLVKRSIFLLHTNEG